MTQNIFMTAFISPLIIGLYAFLLLVLTFYGIHRYWILFLYWRHRSEGKTGKFEALDLEHAPPVTVQLPLYNERFVAERIINAVCAFDYPKQKLEIQVLDDSTDETTALVEARVAYWRERGIDIHHVRRANREGFKAGALGWGLTRAKGEFIAIFDADFVPPSDFLKVTLPCFAETKVGMVQTRWGHLNAGASLLTRLQSMFLDGHFLLEHTARFKSGAFFNFNGTAGIWRRKAIESSGGWSARTLTEDLDLSYRAQLAGWSFIYLPHVVCPAELPTDIYAFRTQQNRWSKGALQVGWKILGPVWKARLPLKTKIEATMHLTSNIGYLLTFLLSVLLLPAIHFKAQAQWPSLAFLELGVFLVTMFSIGLFYTLCQRELYRDWVWRIRDLPALLSFGIGMGLTNAMAVWEGLTGKETDFIRTPKYGDALDVKAAPIYSNPKLSFVALHLFFALYSLSAMALAVAQGGWKAVPFLSLFVFGFVYMSYLAIDQGRFLKRSST